MNDKAAPVSKQQLSKRWGETAKHYHQGLIPYSVYLVRNYNILFEAIEGGLTWIEVCEVDLEIPTDIALAQKDKV